jgi:uncharacterized protein YebE (UPF0316 family)
MELFFLCFKIFFARIFDVSIGTIRTILMVKGRTSFMAMLAFVEVFVWFLVAREALVTDVKSIFIPISYSLGYATGTLIGAFISNTFIKGIVGVQVVLKKDSQDFLKLIRKHGYAVSVIDLKDDLNGNKRDLLYFQINSRNLKDLINLIKKYDNKAFIVVNETKAVQNGFIK